MISLIIPVYNSGAYLLKTCYCLSNQTYRNFEIIFVDDGSLDNSKELIEEYPFNEIRVLIVSQPNQGASFARNVGIEQASGEYIMFIDADDQFEPDYLEILLNNLYQSKADISICGHDETYGNHVINYGKGKKRILNADEAFDTLMRIDLFGGYLWNKLFKRSVIGDIRFNNKVKMMEDALFCTEVLAQCERIIYDPKILYHYIKRKGSLTSFNFSEATITSMDALDEMKILIENRKINLKRFSRFYATTNLNHLMQGYHNELLTEELKAKLMLYFDHYSPKTKLQKIIFSKLKTDFKSVYRVWKPIYKMRSILLNRSLED